MICKKKFFSLLTVFIMLCSFLKTIPVVYASTDVSNLYPVESTFNFLKSVEGCRLDCYWDVNQWSVGFGNKCPYEHETDGTTYGQKGGHTITENQARELFDSKITGYVNTLKANCKGLSMEQNQFDALLSATYNHGNVNFNS